VPPLSSSFTTFDAADRAQLAAVGIPLAEAERQLALFAAPPPPTRLLRPCTIGDGIEQIAAERHEVLLERYRSARDAGRFSKFVPASGAATRMFPSLIAVARDARPLAAVAAASAAGEAEARDVMQFLAALPLLPFFELVETEIVRRGLLAAGELGKRLDAAVADPSGGHLDLQQLLAAVLEPEGLDYGHLPKALLPFHRYPGTWRSAFGEHVAEGLELVGDGDRQCRLHFTMSEAERERFARVQALALAYYSERGVRLAIEVSHQERATDTLAVERDGRPARRQDGTLLLRPGGHGSLLGNLARWAWTGADLVFVKNIDNVVRSEALAETIHWRSLLAGRLLEVEEAIHHHLDALGDATPTTLAAAEQFAAETLGATPPVTLADEGLRRWLLALFDRPLRVCGVVRNVGEPGGGPFWVASREGPSRQIVEASQIDRSDPGQDAQLRAATHFNPVDMVLALRDRQRRSFDLARFVEPSAAFLAQKKEGGRTLRVLEHPGLWNGSMAYWNTLFVEIPLTCFAPVKTVFDLLRPAHQPPKGG
jgi:hypothetical protein